MGVTGCDEENLRGEPHTNARCAGEKLVVLIDFFSFLFSPSFLSVSQQTLFTGVATLTLDMHGILLFARRWQR